MTEFVIALSSASAIAERVGPKAANLARLHGAGAAPLSAGGDHLVTLPILRAIAGERPVGVIHFDAHSDTSDSYFGGEKYTHGTPTRAMSSFAGSRSTGSRMKVAISPKRGTTMPESGSGNLSVIYLSS